MRSPKLVARVKKCEAERCSTTERGRPHPEPLQGGRVVGFVDGAAINRC